MIYEYITTQPKKQGIPCAALMIHLQAHELLISSCSFQILVCITIFIMQDLVDMNSTKYMASRNEVNLECLTS